MHNDLTKLKELAERCCESCGVPLVKKAKETWQKFVARRTCSVQCCRDLRCAVPIGARFGLLVVLERHPTHIALAHWKCRCDCGNEPVVSGSSLRLGHTTSCGCARSIANKKRLTTHGGSMNHPLYATWCSMHARCTNPNRPEYKNYGGRGIKVCEDWDSFAIFLRDVGDKPSPEHSIDRINNDGNYEPSNVRWATRQTQAENTTVAVKITHAGETLTLSEWERRRGYKQGTISRRISSGWSIDEAIDIPPVLGQKIHPEAARDVSAQPRGRHGQFVIDAALEGGGR